jgi:hypothetical protein
MNDATATEIGLAVVILLNLKPLSEYKGHSGGDRYDTEYGTKTIIGIGRTIAKIVEDQRAIAFSSDETI